MSTALLDPAPSAVGATFTQPHAAGTLPAVYIGTVAGFRELPAIDLYNLLVPVGEHPVGSTVSRTTLERFGYRLPAVTRRGPTGGAAFRSHDVSAACA